jgi:hypothetical protein
VRPLSCCAFHSPASAVLCLTLMQREHRQRSFMPRNADYSSEIKNYYSPTTIKGGLPNSTLSAGLPSRSKETEDAIVLLF